MKVCIIVTGEAPFGGVLNLAKSLGEVSALVAGSRDLAQSVASRGVSEVFFIQTDLAESKARVAAKFLASLNSKVVLTTPTPAAKVIAAAVANELEGVLIPALTNLKFEGETAIAEQSSLGGRVIETFTTQSPVVALYAAEDAEVSSGAPVEIKSVEDPENLSYEMSATISSSGANTSGLSDAARIVSFGRGVKSKEDVSIIEALAKAANAQLGCSMPIADDLGWLAKERYVGRSGQKVSPKIYFAIGISGAPQHMEGVRKAKVVVAVNNDPDARIFKSADFGIVGDLYEIVPALTKALS